MGCPGLQSSRPMTECNGCGACCHPFQMIHSPQAIELGREVRVDGSFGRKVDEEQLAFARAHLSPIRRGDARRMTPWSRDGGYSEVIIGGEINLVPAHYYVCDLFDQETRRCTDYEHRPGVCRDYPWYGDPPDRHKVLPDTCSYNADVGRPVAEVAVAGPVRAPSNGGAKPAKGQVRGEI